MANEFPSIANLPIRNAFFDEHGNLTRAWISYLQALERRLISILSATATDDLILTNTFEPIVGTEITLDQNGLWVIIGTITFTADPASAGVQGQLSIGGTPYGATIQEELIGTYDRSRVWLYDNAGENVALLEAKKNAGAGVSTAYSGSSGIIAIFFGNLIR